MTPAPTLAQLLAACTAAQTATAAAAVTITNDASAVATSQAAVSGIETQLTQANGVLAAAVAQQQTDTSALLPDALAAQAAWNAVVAFLQQPPAEGSASLLKAA